MSNYTVSLEAEYKIYDQHGGHVLVRPSPDIPGLTEIIYVDKGEDPMRSRHIAIDPEVLKLLIRAPERRLPEAETEATEG